MLTTNSIVLDGTGIPTHGIFFSTALSSAVFSYLMGFSVNLPVVLGPSLALSILFSQVSVNCPENLAGDISLVSCPHWGTSSLPWSDTLGAIFISGWFYLFFTAAGLRGYLYEAVPKSLRASIAVGTGFFITMVGLKIGHITRVTVRGEVIPLIYTAGSCVKDATGSVICSNYVDLDATWYNHGIAHFNDNAYARIAVLGLVFAVALELFKVKGSLIISIWLATFIGINYFACKSEWNSNDDSVHSCVTDLHIWSGNSQKIPFIVDISNIPAGKLSFRYAKTPFFWQVVFSFLFFELYDSYGVLTGIVTRMGDTKNHPTVAVDRVNRAMMVDGFGVWLGAIMGTNSVSVYIESNTGVEVGARTGLAAIVCGTMMFLCLLFVYPFVAIIPACATTCALVMVGCNTMQEYRRIDTDNFIHLVSGFLTIAVMGFTYSITNGICFGIIFYTFLQLFAYFVTRQLAVLFPYFFGGFKIRDGVKVELPHPVLLVTAAFMAVRFAVLKQQ